MTYNDDTPSYMQSQSQGNPAWNPLLEQIPEDIRGNVQPLLADWDRGVQKRFDDLHSQYKPYEQFASEGVDAGTIQYGLNLMNQLNSNEGALQVYNALNEHLRTQGLIDVEEEVQYETDEDPYGRKIDDLYNNFGALAEAFLGDKERERLAQQEAYEDQLLEAELARAHEQYGDFDEREVLMRLAHGEDDMTIDDAIEDYNEFVSRIGGRKAAPRVLGSGGAFPMNEPIDPRKMNDSQTTDYVADILRMYNNQ